MICDRTNARFASLPGPVYLRKYWSCSGVAMTFHVQALPDEKLMVAGLVEEGAEPRLVPDSAVVVGVLQRAITGDHSDSWQSLQLC